MRDNSIKKECQQRALEITSAISDVNRQKYAKDQEQYAKLTKLEEDMNTIQSKYVKREDWRRGISASNIIAGKVNADYAVTQDMEVIDNMRSRDFGLKGSRAAKAPKKACVNVEAFELDIKNPPSVMDMDRMQVRDFTTQELGISRASLSNAMITTLNGGVGTFQDLTVNKGILQNVNGKAQFNESKIHGDFANTNVKNAKILNLKGSNLDATGMFAGNINAAGFDTGTLYSPQGEVRKITSGIGKVEYTESSNATFGEIFFHTTRGSNLDAGTLSVKNAQISGLRADRFNIENTMNVGTIKGGTLLEAEKLATNVAHVDQINVTRQINVGTEVLNASRIRNSGKEIQPTTAQFGKSNVFNAPTEIQGELFAKGKVTNGSMMNLESVSHEGKNVNFKDNDIKINADKISMNGFVANNDKTYIKGNIDGKNIRLAGVNTDPGNFGVDREFAVISDNGIAAKIDGSGNFVAANNITWNEQEMSGTGEFKVKTLGLSRDGRLSASNLVGNLKTSALVAGNIQMGGTQLANTVGELALNAPSKIKLDGTINLNTTKINNAVYLDEICFGKNCMKAADLPKFRNQGIKGKRGIVGKDGDRGEQGKQGPQGIQGPKGPEGLPGNNNEPGNITSINQLSAKAGLKLGSNIYFTRDAEGDLIDKQNVAGFGKYYDLGDPLLRFYTTSTLKVAPGEELLSVNENGVVIDGRPVVTNTINVSEPEIGPWIQNGNDKKRYGVGHFDSNKMRIYGADKVSVGVQSDDTYGELLEVGDAKTTVKNGVFCIGETCVSSGTLANVLTEQIMPKSAKFTDVKHTNTMFLASNEINPQTMAIMKQAEFELRTKKPQNCTYTSWTDWSPCSDGKQHRTRNITQQGQYYGQECKDISETRACGPTNCSISGWSECSNKCGKGTRTRNVDASATNGGTCDTGIKMSEKCFDESAYSAWRKEGTCGNRCGLSQQKMVRDGSCQQQTRYESCFDDSAYGSWQVERDCSKCTRNTGNHTKIMARYGNGCARQQQEYKCPDDNSECPVNCQQGEWYNVGTCSTQCGSGWITQQRDTRVEPKFGGTNCEASQRSVQCTDYSKCPVNCAGYWTGWSGCTNGCGGGWQSRDYIVTQEPRNGGQACPVVRREAQQCNTHPCPVDCQGWWTAWSECDNCCGWGKKYRHYIVTQNPLHGGAACPATTQYGDCYENYACEASALFKGEKRNYGYWEEWALWTPDRSAGIIDLRIHWIILRPRSQVLMYRTNTAIGAPFILQNRTCKDLPIDFFNSPWTNIAKLIILKKV